MPDWVHSTPQPGNDTYLYVCETGEGKTLREALNQAIGRAFQTTANRIGQLISSNDISTALQNGTPYNVISQDYNIPINKVCEFEMQDTDTGNIQVYVLFQIAKKGNISPVFDTFSECSKSTIDKDMRQQAIRHIQTRAIPASVFVPGVGQMVKGQYLKGGLILGGEAIAVAGMITCFSQHSNYSRKITQTSKVKLIQSYDDNRAAWQYAGYGFVALAGGLWLYSLIDAIAVRPSDAAINKTMESLTFAPMYMPENNGIGLAMQIKF